jgi:hypothetical protein
VSQEDLPGPLAAQGKKALSSPWNVPRNELAKNHVNDKTQLISRSLGCCPHRNVEISQRQAALKARPDWGVLKVLCRGHPRA